MSVIWACSSLAGILAGEASAQTLQQGSSAAITFYADQREYKTSMRRGPLRRPGRSSPQEMMRAHNEVFTPSKAWPALWEPWSFSRDLKS
jgi:hypothetical protein